MAGNYYASLATALWKIRCHKTDEARANLPVVLQDAPRFQVVRPGGVAQIRILPTHGLFTIPNAFYLFRPCAVEFMLL